MPYSDLSDAWNSYDPRYLRVTDQGDEPNWQRMNEQEGELIPDKSNTRYYDQHWLAPGQSPAPFGANRLDPNALGIYPGLLGSRPPPVGDEVISTPRQPFVNTMPRVNRDVAFGAPWDDPGNQNAMMGRWDFDRGAMKISDVRGAAPSPDDPQIQGPTRPGFNDPTVLARVYGDIQRDLRLDPNQALGFLSNLNAESFGFAKPQEEGPQIRGRNTGGLGWGQWTANRRAAFEDYLRQTGTPPTSYEGNYGFLTAELQDPKWQPFLDNLRRQRDAESATRYTERGYENPSRKTGRQDWLARTRRELPASQSALGREAQGAAPLAPQDQVIGSTSLLEPNYLRRMSYGSAPLANSLEDARPYRPLPPNYLRRQPFATGSSQL